MTPPNSLTSRALRVGPQTGDVVQQALGHPLGPALPVERDGEAVRLVAEPLEQVEGLRAPAQADRLGIAGPVDLLELLGQGGQLDLVFEPELTDDPLGHVQLPLAPVDQQQVGAVGEAPRPLAGGRLLSPS